MKWLTYKNMPYDPLRDTWTIHNKKYSGKALFLLANSNEKSFKIKQVNSVTVLEEIEA